ncbi:cation diffusion facilitator family transporter [Trichocoleus sp. FACHB-262]|uniref:cation diffusion facilitator family transporter n=1 Tax=Trichocoleus sp. FACHB-262 TaxID=2692869 RepID=UPI0016836721|nr:cation diffusion facilitator family transporter [Trichocoleus sp. FACHB-262]MBD2120118.1 cation transporter [Trichocoleus sp. FACHB-262]
MLHHHHSSHCDHSIPTASLDPGSTPVQKLRLLWIALILTGCFSLAELIVSHRSHSLALLADSGHLFSDTLSLALALLATWIARLPASEQAPFGYRRVEILAALANGLSLVAIACWVGWEAIARLQSPPTEILSLPMLITAVVGLGVNSLNAWFLHGDSHHDLNLRGAFLHMVADAISSVGVILAAIAVGKLHWLWADGAISLLVAGFIATGAIPLIQQSLNILLERTPQQINVPALAATFMQHEAVVSIDALKLWTVALGQEVLCVQLQVNLRDGLARDRLLQQIQTQMQQEFGIQEVIVQMTLAPGQQAIATQLSPTLSNQIVLPSQ